MVLMSCVRRVKNVFCLGVICIFDMFFIVVVFMWYFFKIGCFWMFIVWI